MAKLTSESLRIADTEWMTFRGGELEGKRPKVLCPACREQLNRAGAQAFRSALLCFQCYRAELERDGALKAAGQLDTASDARFQSVLPFDPVNTARLAALKAERTAERAALVAGVGRFADRRRQAQIVARHALRSIGAGLRTKRTSPAALERERAPERAPERTMMAAIHAAELQLPESWLPFVVSR